MSPGSSEPGELNRKAPKLSGFYMAGRWVEPWGGVTTAAISGRNAVRCMGKEDGVPFGE